MFLLMISLTSGTSSAILAEVEPQRYAVSYPKAVRIKEVYVVPGQQVKKGDRLIKVERPDLLLDKESKQKKIDLLKSNLEKKELQKENKIYLNDIQFELRRSELKNQIQRLHLTINQQNHLKGELRKLNFAGGQENSADSLMEKRLELLHIELGNLVQEHQVKKQEILSVFDLESSSLMAEVDQLEKEAELLQQEEQELIQYARVDGAIGNIYVEIEELVPPYTNLVSVYENNPTIIRAFTNEHEPLELKSGADVYIESTNRQYRIKGKIIEVGSRIIEYPQRLRTFDQMPSWGRELFIEIPEDSRFLNGEKVFVILED